MPGDGESRGRKSQAGRRYFPKRAGLLDMQGTGERFGVRRWTTWEGQAGANEKPDLSFVPAMLRRRLSRLSALTVSVANACLQQEAGIPVVFASQHGELARTADLLVGIARGEPLSPTAFSLSVHNSATGLLTLTRAERAPATAIAAGPHTIAMGVLEAVSQSRERQGPVLLVCADSALTEPYKEAITGAAEFAFAMLVEADGEYTMEQAVEEAADGTAIEQALGLTALIRKERDCARLGDGVQSWRVRHA